MSFVLSRQALELLTARLGVQPVVVSLGLLPRVVVNRDGENDKEGLRLDAAERVENGIVQSASEGLLGVAGNGVAGNALLGEGT